jgi:hypothetical protein
VKASRCSAACQCVEWVIAVYIGIVVDPVCFFLYCFRRLAPGSQRLLYRTEVTLGEHAFTCLSKAFRALCGFSSASSSALVCSGLGIMASLTIHGIVCVVGSNILAHAFVIHPFSDVPTLFTLAIVEVKSGSQVVETS